MEGYIGQIIMFAGKFAPKDWAFCDGRILPISQYTALYSIIGSQYGGDDRTSFALPNLCGRVPVGTGERCELRLPLGQAVGRSTVDVPIHSSLPYSTEFGTESSPEGNCLAVAENGLSPLKIYAKKSNNNSKLYQTISTVQPSLGLNFIICLQGLYPERN